ncbi:hypothetical protein ACJJTC_007562 [Scirpophaga incertulas]
MCGPQQKCENFFGGYSCQCPVGHRVHGKNGCIDVDECTYGSPCSYNSKCVNTVGSFRCECRDGFRNSPSNDKMCVDIDECEEMPHACHQLCSNAWGSYRCYCKRGYRLDKDNSARSGRRLRTRGRLCGGDCLNEPGSYRCSCPRGYRLGDDGKSCIDIDECESGEATCAASKEPSEVCQNTRGGYHCHRIRCPAGYALQARHRCTRIQRSCPISDWDCQQQPSTYTYNFITFVANIFLPTGSVDLFTMHGPSWPESVVSFELRMLDMSLGTLYSLPKGGGKYTGDLVSDTFKVASRKESNTAEPPPYWTLSLHASPYCTRMGWHLFGGSYRPSGHRKWYYDW